MQKRSIYLWLLAIVVSACASTRKTTTTISEQQRDTTQVERTDSVRNTGASLGGWSLDVNDFYREVMAKVESDSNEELILEHISETTDTAGNKTTATDRVIKRRGSNTKQTAKEVDTGKQTHQHETFMNYWDSLSLNNVRESLSHWANKDSSFLEKDREAGGNKSWWQRLQSHLFSFVILGLLVVCVCLYQATSRIKI